MAIIDITQVPPNYTIGPKSYDRTEEVVSDRYADGTTLNRIYVANVLDETDTPTGDQVEITKVVKERGTNIFYDETDYSVTPNSAPSWSRADDNFEISAVNGVAYEIRKKNIIFGLADNTNRAWHQIMRFRRKENFADLKFKHAAVVYIDNTTKNTQVIANANSGVTPTVNGTGKIVTYTNVYPQVDVKYAYLEQGPEEVFVLKNTAILPDPATYGMDPATTFVVFASVVDVAGWGGFIDGSDSFDTFKVLDNDVDLTVTYNGNTIKLGTIRQGSVWDSSPEFAYVDRVTESHVKTWNVLYKGGANNYFGKAVKYSWLSQATAPVYIDPLISGNKTGNIAGNETWFKGYTYWMSGNFVINSGETLTLEPGVVSKCNGSLNGIRSQTGGRIIARGNPYDWIIITNAANTAVGEDVTGEAGYAAGTMNFGFIIDSSTDAFSAESRFEYCKISGAPDANNQGGMRFFNLELDNPVRNCIADGTAVFIQTSNSSQTNTVINCIATGTTAATGGGIQSNGLTTTVPMTLNAYNCTLDNNSNGFSGVDVSGTLNMTWNLFDCIMSNNTYGIRYNGVGSTTQNIKSCAWYNNTNDVSGGSLTTGTNPIVLSNNPYDSANACGSYYLKNNTPAKGAGSQTVESAGLTGKTTQAPVEIIADITTPTTLSPIVVNDGTVDAGFHYDRLDYVIGNSSSNYQINLESQLTVEPGTRIAFFRDSSNTGAKITINSADAFLDLTGDDDNPILVTSVYANNDNVNNLPLDYDLDDDFRAYTAGTSDWDRINPGNYNDTFHIKNVRFMYGNCAICPNASVSTTFRFPIENNVFEYFKNDGIRVILTTASTSADIFKIKNNLFIHSAGGIDCQTWNSNQITTYPDIVNNTFFNCSDGVRIWSNTSSGTINNLLENNIFFNCDYGVQKDFTGYPTPIPTLNLTENDNCFYLNQSGNIYDVEAGSAITLDGSDITSNPVFCHRSGQSLTGDVDAYDGINIFPDGFRLNQSGAVTEVSRFPLRITDANTSNGISTSGITFSADNNGSEVGLHICATDIFQSDYTAGTHHLCSYVDTTGGSPAYTDDAAVTHPRDLLVFFELNAAGGLSNTLSATAGATITLTTGTANYASSYSIVIALPEFTMTYDTGTYYLGFWVAADGSTFYAGTNGTTEQTTQAAAVDMLAEYAMRGKHATNYVARQIRDTSSCLDIGNNLLGYKLNGSTDVTRILDTTYVADTVDIGFHYPNYKVNRPRRKT